MITLSDGTKLTPAMVRELRYINGNGYSGNWFCFLALARRGLAEAWERRVSEISTVVEAGLTDAGRAALAEIDATEARA
jgi:hypothetical protein